LADIIKWPVVLVCPGEDELTLMADLSARRDARIVAVADPQGTSVGAGLAEVMGVKVITDLASLDPGSAQYLVYPAMDEVVQAYVDVAAEYGLTAVAAPEFVQQMGAMKLAVAPVPPAIPHPSPTPPAAPSADRDELIEKETATIHRTLSRIEEALDREALLRWLLGLATRATGATSGSIMLFDDVAEELYIGFAYGLSQHTMHSTRLKPGEGIAGRVAVTRQAELVCDNRHPGASRDRLDIQQAISAPIIWEDHLLGVINVSNSEGDSALSSTALATIGGLTHRFGLILDRFLKLQVAQDSRVFRTIDEDLQRDTGHPQAIAATLRDWSRDLRDAAGARSARLEILTDDGDLFWADPEQTGYESPASAEKIDILTHGHPLVTHDIVALAEANTEVTVFTLPVGNDSQRALLVLEFGSAARAHQFHSLSGELIYLVNRHLSGYLERAVTADQLDRLTTLTTALSELATAKDQDARERQALAAACRLTGAAKAVLVTAPEPAAALSGPERDLYREAARLLVQAGKTGWKTTVMTTGDDQDSQSVLVVPPATETPFPGLVLFGKSRLHPTDSNVFSEYDAVFARQLLPLLQAPAEPSPAITAADTEALVGTLTAERSGDFVKEAFTKVLQREMDRCDRYHTVLGLVGFRYPEDQQVPLRELVAEIDRRLRSSDSTGCLADGTIMIIVPEDIQSLPRLQKRVSEVIASVVGQPDLPIRTATRIYPGGGDDPEALVAAITNLLDA